VLGDEEGDEAVTTTIGCGTFRIHVRTCSGISSGVSLLYLCAETGAFDAVIEPAHLVCVEADTGFRAN
jgi:hypothetical protein